MKPGDADVVYVGFLLGHGGDALQMLDLASGMQRRGGRVRVVVPAHEHSVKFKERCDALGVDCDRSELLVADMNGSRQRLPALVRLLRTLDAPIVHFHSGNSCLPRTATIALELLRYQRAFVTLQSPYETISPRGGRARFWAAAARRRFLAVVSPSEHATQFQIRCGVPSQLAVTVRNSIDVQRVRNGDAAVPRAVLGVGPDTPVVVFTSRLDAQKRPVDAVRIFRSVADHVPSAVLAFVGSGAEETAVRDEANRLGIGDRVRLVGYQTNIADWLACATVWLLPTERENFSVAVLEALAAGCPVLATSCPGNDEVLVDGENALTFAVGDLDAASDGLRRLLADSSLRRRLSRAGRSSGGAFTSDNMVEQYRMLYDRHPNPPAVARPHR